MAATWCLVGCGGGQATTETAKGADPSAGAGAAPSSSSPTGASAAPASSDGTTGSTTTVALASSGELQGAKLTETHTVAATSASAAPSAAPHGHDPGRTPADIRAIVMAHRDDARACYDKALPSHPGIEGDLVVQWTIDPKGNVTQVSLDSSRSKISEPSVVACVAAVIQKIQFAPSAGGYETKAFYPFNFHPHNAAKAGGAP